MCFVCISVTTNFACEYLATSYLIPIFTILPEINRRPLAELTLDFDFGAGGGVGWN